MQPYDYFSTTSYRKANQQALSYDDGSAFLIQARLWKGFWFKTEVKNFK